VARAIALSPCGVMVAHGASMIMLAVLSFVFLAGLSADRAARCRIVLIVLRRVAVFVIFHNNLFFF
jgi:hypothetical protein